MKELKKEEVLKNIQKYSFCNTCRGIFDTALWIWKNSDKVVQKNKVKVGKDGFYDLSILSKGREEETDNILNGESACPHCHSTIFFDCVPGDVEEYFDSEESSA